MGGLLQGIDSWIWAEYVDFDVWLESKSLEVFEIKENYLLTLFEHVTHHKIKSKGPGKKEVFLYHLKYFSISFNRRQFYMRINPYRNILTENT